MPDGTDVCASCSEIIVDKSVIQCSQCKSHFHGKCEGVVNLRGFHMKTSWKCKKCIGSVIVSVVKETEAKGTKRVRDNQGNTIEVDAAVIRNLLQKVEELTKITLDLNVKVDRLTAQNQRLEFALSVQSLPAKTQTPISFAGVAGKQQKQQQQQQQPGLLFNNTDTRRQIKNSVANAAVATVCGNNHEVPVETPVPGPTELLPTESDKPPAPDDGARVNDFTLVKPKRKRIMKPLIIGSGETGSQEAVGDGENVPSKPRLTGTDRRHWVYVGRVTAGTSVETVKEYVTTTWALSDVQCVQLANNEELCSFKVGVRESHVKSLLDASKWPRQVAVREFINFRRNPSRPKAEAGNFPIGRQTQPQK